NPTPNGGHTLKLCITNLESILAQLGLTSVDIAGVQGSLFAGNPFDVVGEDGTSPFVLQPINEIDVSKIPNFPTVCPGGSIQYTIQIRNPGATILTNISANDALGSGLTYVSDDATVASTGDAHSRAWTFSNVNLLPGHVFSFHLNATAAAECAGTYENFVHVSGGDVCSTAPLAQADTTATVKCLFPQVQCSGGLITCTQTTAQTHVIV